MFIIRNTNLILCLSVLFLAVSTLHAQGTPLNHWKKSSRALDTSLSRSIRTSLPLKDCYFSEQSLTDLKRALALIAKAKTRMRILKINTKNVDAKRKMLALLKMTLQLLEKIDSLSSSEGDVTIPTRIAETNIFLKKAIRRPVKKLLLKAEAPLNEILNFCNNDQCPNNAEKLRPGVCGCGIADLDRDLDGTPDCIDFCPYDPAKTIGGKCGCGIADSDRDGDGIFDCLDACPIDPEKQSPGKCGCGATDFDTDDDGTADCQDICPNDDDKSGPGVCGCGIPDGDTDRDGIYDCFDGCPDDENKAQPGLCGCGLADMDQDNDGVLDCNDQCPTDWRKTAPGICGCGVLDTDRDGDGMFDCQDQCPDDSNKTSPQVCGCGNIESNVDSDGDGTIDCLDECSSDPNKTDSGVCGCGVSDLYGSSDYDHDGIANCNERVSFNVYKGESWQYRGEDLRVSLGSTIFRNETGETAPGVIWDSSDYTFSFSAWNPTTNKVKTCNDYTFPVSLLFKADILGVEYYGFPSTEPLRACEVHMAVNTPVGPASNN